MYACVCAYVWLVCMCVRLFRLYVQMYVYVYVWGGSQSGAPVFGIDICFAGPALSVCVCVCVCFFFMSVIGPTIEINSYHHDISYLTSKPIVVRKSERTYEVVPLLNFKKVTPDLSGRTVFGRGALLIVSHSDADADAVFHMWVCVSACARVCSTVK